MNKNNNQKIKSKISKIKNRIRFRNKIPPKTLNASHAREFIARTIVLPMLKKRFGERLKSVLLFGSSQLGVRKASDKKSINSDLDIGIVLSKTDIEDIVFRGEIYDQCVKLGVKSSTSFISRDFFNNNTNIENPFQVIYGREFIESQLGKDYEINQRMKRIKMIKTKEKYQNR